MYKEEYIFKSIHDSFIDNNRVIFERSNEFCWEISFRYSNTQRKEKVSRIDFTETDFQELTKETEESIEKKFIDIFQDIPVKGDHDKYEEIYFGYTGKLITDAFISLYLGIIEEKKFDSQLKKIFKLQHEMTEGIKELVI
ncbi:hypothetical protein [Fusobacterium ulcerans]|uniref:hypothetical protein n=1 Tax=Fusobacterium ulcerans TaxID=861 RepID=UPI003FEFF9C9